MSASDARGGLGRASAGEREACQRRDRHGADAAQRHGGAGAVVGVEVALAAVLLGRSIVALALALTVFVMTGVIVGNSTARARRAVPGAMR
ncbi:hypothetical protein [Streptomyces sp. NPDC099088]